MFPFFLLFPAKYSLVNMRLLWNVSNILARMTGNFQRGQSNSKLICDLKTRY